MLGAIDGSRVEYGPGDLYEPEDLPEESSEPESGINPHALRGFARAMRPLVTRIMMDIHTQQAVQTFTGGTGPRMESVMSCATDLLQRVNELERFCAEYCAVDERTAYSLTEAGVLA